MARVSALYVNLTVVCDAMSESGDGRDESVVGVLTALQRTMSLVVDRYIYIYRMYISIRCRIIVLRSTH